MGIALDRNGLVSLPSVPEQALSFLSAQCHLFAAGEDCPANRRTLASEIFSGQKKEG